MARRADYVGNHGGAYTDEAGMSRQFTYVDHDKKTKVGTGKMTDREKKALKSEIEESISKTIECILAMPAVNILKNSQGLYHEFIIRDVEEEKIKWHEDMVRNACKINDILRYNMFNTLWKCTVREQHWFTDMPYDDIIAGKWKELT